ncbi:MAG: sigma-70 family RNA polymerase sigma factor [Clostridia bacterium]|nr:sigma-70 family RNA polymerase sigma factor [Clostridia bacterium]
MTERDKMIENNLGLVHSCAQKFKNRGVEYDDLFQAGCVGLVKAVDGFDETLGFVFSTYAVPAILGEIKRIFRDGGAVKVSRSIKERSRLIWQQKEQYSEEKGREPTVSELAEYVGLSVCETSQLLLATQPVISLTVSEDESDKQFDIPIEGEEERIDEKMCLDECLRDLSENDRKIIDLRYYKSKTQTVVAKELGMSQVQVSRREKKILKEIREKMSV